LDIGSFLKVILCTLNGGLRFADPYWEVKTTLLFLYLYCRGREKVLNLLYLAKKTNWLVFSTLFPTLCQGEKFSHGLIVIHVPKVDRHLEDMLQSSSCLL
jgi:hypothetical protein